MSDAGSEQLPINRARGSGNGRGWVKGQSGNPGGRPRGIEALAREHTPAALARLVRALEDPDSRVAVTAATVLLDRGWGKPRGDLTPDSEKPVILEVRWQPASASVSTHTDVHTDTIDGDGATEVVWQC